MLLQFYTIEDLSQPPSLQGQGLHFVIKSTQRHKWRGLILKEYFEKRGQARLDGWRFWWVLVHVWEGPWCTALPSRGHSGPYGDSECGIWTGCTSHHQSRCIIVGYIRQMFHLNLLSFFLLHTFCYSVLVIVNLQLLFWFCSDLKWLSENSLPFGSMPLYLICHLCLSLSVVVFCCVVLDRQLQQSW